MRYIYSSRDSSRLSFGALLKNIQRGFDLEKNQEMKENLKPLLKNGVR